MVAGAYPAIVKKAPPGASESLCLSRVRKWSSAGVDSYGFVNRNTARSSPLDFERLRRQVLGAAKRHRKRNGRAPVGEFEVDLRREGVAVALDLVSLFANRLLKFVKSKFPLLDDCGSVGTRRLLRRSEYRKGDG